MKPLSWEQVNLSGSCVPVKGFGESRASLHQVILKDGAYYCYCAYGLRISRYSDFIWVVIINTGI